MHYSPEATLEFGKVVSSSPLTKTVLVAINGNPHPLCCQIASDAHSQWGGVSGQTLPTAGSVVVVARSQSLDYGIVLGCLPPLFKASEDGWNHSGMSEARLPSSLDQAHNLFDCGFDNYHMESGQYRPEDLYPGERWWMGDMGSAMGITESAAVLRGSELAGFEAFSLYDKARIYGHRLEQFTGAGESRHYADLGVTMSEEYLAPNEALSMGMKNYIGWSFEPEEDVEVANMLSGGWGYRKYAGTLPFGISEHMSIPKTEEKRHVLGGKKDIGVSSSIRDFAGNRIEKGSGMVGFVKANVHPVPCKLYEHDDPRGNRDDAFIEGSCESAYEINPNLDPSMYLRDMMAWDTDRTIGVRWSKREKDWFMQSSKDAPSIKDFGAIRDAYQTDGPWFRDPPTQGTMEDDHAMMHDRKCWSGDAWILAMPNGAISIRDIWGSSISMYRGDIDISASNNINLHAGRHIITHSGGDTVVHARNNLDCIAQEKQLRLWAKKDAYLASKEGGIMISAESPGGNMIREVGERNMVSGIVMRAVGAPITSMAKSQVFGADSHFMFTGRSEGIHPAMFMRSSSVLFDTTGGLQVRQGGPGAKGKAGYTTVGDGVWTTGQGTFETGLWAITGGVSLGPQVNEAACVSDQWKSLADILPPAFDGRSIEGASPAIIAKSKGEASGVRFIKREQLLKPNPAGTGSPPDEKIDWDEPPMLNGYKRSDLEDAWFWFRTEASYLTDQGFEWHEKPWEREWVGKADWGEVPKTEHGKNKTAPFPGVRLWDEEDCLVQLEEKNVMQDGTAVKWDTMVSSPSTTNVKLTKLGRHART